MPDTKLGNNQWVPGIRDDKIETFTESDDASEETYKIVDAHPILNRVLDLKAFFRTHAAAVWYNMKSKTTVAQIIKQQQEEIASLRSEVEKLNTDSLQNAPRLSLAPYCELVRLNRFILFVFNKTPAVASGQELDLGDVSKLALSSDAAFITIGPVPYMIEPSGLWRAMVTVKNGHLMLQNLSETAIIDAYYKTHGILIVWTE